MIPIDPAKEVRKVRVFLVIKLLSERDSAVKNDMEVFCFFAFLAFPLRGLPSAAVTAGLSCAVSSAETAAVSSAAGSSDTPSYGFESETTCPSRTRMMRVA